MKIDIVNKYDFIDKYNKEKVSNEFIEYIIKQTMWKELLLIAGWVPLWEMLELELFSDVEGRKRRAILKRLIKSEIVVNKECLVD